MVTLEPAPVPPSVASVVKASAMVFTLDVCQVKVTSTSDETRPTQLNFATSKRSPGVPRISSRIRPWLRIPMLCRPWARRCNRWLAAAMLPAAGMFCATTDGWPGKVPADVARHHAAVEIDPAAGAGADDQRDGAALERSRRAAPRRHCATPATSSVTLRSTRKSIACACSFGKFLDQFHCCRKTRSRSCFARTWLRGTAKKQPVSFLRVVDCRMYRTSGAHFLALEDDVADHEQHDRAGDQADDLRPHDQQALQQRQRRAGIAPGSTRASPSPRAATAGSTHRRIE